MACPQCLYVSFEDGNASDNDNGLYRSFIRLVIATTNDFPLRSFFSLSLSLRCSLPGNDTDNHIGTHTQKAYLSHTHDTQPVEKTGEKEGKQCA